MPLFYSTVGGMSCSQYDAHCGVCIQRITLLDSAIWYNRGTSNPEDPWISLANHPNNVIYGTQKVIIIIYGYYARIHYEASFIPYLNS